MLPIDLARTHALMSALPVVTGKVLQGATKECKNQHSNERPESANRAAGGVALARSVTNKITTVQEMLEGEAFKVLRDPVHSTPCTECTQHPRDASRRQVSEEHGNSGGKIIALNGTRVGVRKSHCHLGLGDDAPATQFRIMGVLSWQVSCCKHRLESDSHCITTLQHFNLLAERSPSEQHLYGTRKHSTTICRYKVPRVRGQEAPASRC